MAFASDDLGKLVLRLSIGGLMLLHGINKLINGIAGIERRLAGKSLPEFIAYGVYVGEVLAPIFLIIGFRSRVAAAVLAFNMVVAVWLSHASDVIRLTKSGAWAIELQMLYLLGAVAIMLLGAGRLAVSSTHRWD